MSLAYATKYRSAFPVPRVRTLFCFRIPCKPRQDILSTSAELTGSDVTLSLPLRCVDKFEEP